MSLQVIIGLEPSKSTAASTDFNIMALYRNDDDNVMPIQVPTTSYSRSGTSASFTNVKLIANYWNNSSQAYTYDLGWALYDSNGNVKSTHTVSTSSTVQAGYYNYPTSNIALGSGLSSGTYYLKPICRLSGTSQFHPCRGTGHNYIKATITATSMQLKVYDPLTVQSATAATISGTTLSSVEGTTFNASITVKNENTNTYNDYIIAKLYKKEPNSGNTGYFCGSQSQTVYLGHNNTTTLNYAFTNLDFDETYFVIFYCISNGEQVRINATSSRKVESPFDRLDVNQDGSVTGSDVTAVYNTIFGVTNRYHRWADTNGDGEVTGSDITAIYNKILGL